MNLAAAGGYDGIDLDYENLRASDRAAFTSFVQHLAGALHAQGKLLTVNVYAKTSEPGTWDGPQAQDWWAIGQAADQVRIMTYEYSWSTSPPGPIAPVNWVNDVIGYATSQIPPGKSSRECRYTDTTGSASGARISSGPRRWTSPVDSACR